MASGEGLFKKGEGWPRFPAPWEQPGPTLALTSAAPPVANYILIFRYTADTVDVLAVLHASRDTIAHFEAG